MMAPVTWMVFLSAAVTAYEVAVPPEVVPFSFGTVRAGMRRTVVCMTIFGDRPLSFEWLKDGKLVTLLSTSKDAVITRQVNEYASALVLPRAEPRFEGSYTCRISNDAGTSSYTSQLKVRARHRSIKSLSGACEGFQCGSGECLAAGDRCDGAVNCADQSDEAGCDLCDGFQCDNGKCIPGTQECDEHDNCGDYSDELHCDCCDGFQCGDHCIDKWYLCDGDQDCPDNSDEAHCGTCNGFLCKNGNCIDEDYKCDYDDDCGDNSDETYCSGVCIQW